MIGVLMDIHHGKLFIVHPSGYYIAFTREEWEEAKTAGDELFENRNAVPGQVEKG